MALKVTIWPRAPRLIGCVYVLQLFPVHSFCLNILLSLLLLLRVLSSHVFLACEGIRLEGGTRFGLFFRCQVCIDRR